MVKQLPHVKYTPPPLSLCSGSQVWARGYHPSTWEVAAIVLGQTLGASNTPWSQAWAAEGGPVSKEQGPQDGSASKGFVFQA